MNQRFRGRLGELPETLYRERQPGMPHNPASNVALDWTNPYKTTNFSLQIGTTPRNLLQDNPLRTYLLIQNLSAAADVFIAFTTDVILNAGILIVPRGNYEFIGGEQGGSFCPKASVNIVASAANVRVAVVEGTIEPYNQRGKN